MRAALIRHPDTPSDAVADIAVDVARTEGAALALHFRATGRIAALLLPAVTSSVRADELWRHTCFEAFVRASGSVAYYELNFSPSWQWAAYAFTDIRVGMRAVEIAHPRIAAETTPTSFEMQIAVELSGLADLPLDAAWSLGLSAVIEETSGRKSYWALSHPPGKPDFHHSDCFALELPAASRS